ncbi:ferritin-like domain-containing protein [Pedobacter sp. SD-b]|uniref:Ferritin-like domain-containing protein n=1 Tax=Pedobacter segetis TaxID=2793069 RepID=A0ABS1BN86_9SPHI|nr:ferritin-like domain-containing protein [Pedobacter segetis]MBK0384355.1 ferritin-like domain-containing protein [Pedobacter segetis]
MSINGKANQLTQEMKDSDFHKFFIEELQDIYWAETHLIKALPKMQKAATSTQLANAIEKHLIETKKHVETLENVFELLEEKAKAKKCEAMAGILEEANVIVNDTEKDTMTRDAGIILAAQKVEHYEIATYGTLRVFAQHMGHTEIYDLLSETLKNEKETDVALTKLAESFVNEEAVAE